MSTTQQPISGPVAPAPPISTLALPRLLMIHGGGTNAAIFYLQCRTLRAALEPYFRLVFPNAPFVTQTPGPDVLSVYSSYSPFRLWLRIRHSDHTVTQQEAVSAIDGAIEAAMREDDTLGATGQWVGMLGFSQGCKVAASMLAREQTRQDKEKSGQRAPAVSSADNVKSADGQTTSHEPFKSVLSARWRFAVLFAGRGPLVNMNVDERDARRMGLTHANEVSGAFGHARPDGRADDESEMLRLPTLHVHGVEDPGWEYHQQMHEEYCPDARVIEWGGDHRMPFKKADTDAIVHEIMTLAMQAKALKEYL